MSGYEYAVVPAPKKGLKAKGVKSTEDRFAHALQTIMNEYGANGWDYIRTDTLPCEERTGLTGRTTTFQNLLVFRKPLAVTNTSAPPLLAPSRNDTATTAPETPDPADDIPRIDSTPPDTAPEQPDLERPNPE